MYNELVQALQATDIPFAEFAWRNAPQTGAYGIIAPDSEAATVWADGKQQLQAIQGTIDLFVRDKGLTEMLTVQSVLAAQGISWRLNAIMYEPARQITHYEWVFELEML